MQKESSVQCLGLVDFAIGLLNFILNLTDVQVQFFEEFKLQSKNCVTVQLTKKYLGLLKMSPLLSGIVHAISPTNGKL